MITKTLDISTIHIPKDYIFHINKFILAEYDTGFFCWIPDLNDIDIPVPDWFKDIVNLAIDNGVTYICIHDEGTVVDYLDQFSNDWE